MTKLKTHQTDVMAEVIKRALKLRSLGAEITPAVWNFYYELVRTEHQVDTILWKLKNLGMGGLNG